MGPPPKPADQRVRQNRTPGAVRLPAAGRQGDPPPFPLPSPGERELVMWAEVWRTPQAVQWERMAWFHEVGLYVRHSIGAELGLIPHAVEARLLADRLGLNPLALLRLRWEIADQDVRELRPQSSSARWAHLRVLPGSGLGEDATRSTESP